MLRFSFRFMSYKLPGTFITKEIPDGPDSFKKVMIYKPANIDQTFLHKRILIYSVDKSRMIKRLFPMPWSLGTWSMPIVIWQMAVGNIPATLFTFAAILSALIPHYIFRKNLDFEIKRISIKESNVWEIESFGRDSIYFNNDYLNFSEKFELNEEGKLQKNIQFTLCHLKKSSDDNNPDSEENESISGKKFIDNGSSYMIRMKEYKEIRSMTRKYKKEGTLSENYILPMPGSPIDDLDINKKFNIKISAKGTVWNPELFAAFLQKAEIDTSYFKREVIPEIEDKDLK